jgi:hypothetical protein
VTIAVKKLPLIAVFSLTETQSRVTGNANQQKNYIKLYCIKQDFLSRELEKLDI